MTTDASGAPSGADPGPLYSGSDRPARRDRTPLITGSALVLVGAVWLLAQFDFIGKLGVAALVGALLGGIAFAFFYFYQLAPERRWGFLVPAGFFASVAAVSVLEIVGLLPKPFVPLMFFLGPAAAFYAIYERDERRSWALLCTGLMLLVGVTGFVASIPWVGEHLGWPVFLFGLAGCSFWYFLRTGKDWSLLPSGLFATLGGTALLGEMAFPGRMIAAASLLGLGMSFAMLYLLGRPGHSRWARLPAVALSAVGVVVVLLGPLLTIGIPLALVAFGLYLLLFHDANGNSRGDAPPSAPAASGTSGS